MDVGTLTREQAARQASPLIEDVVAVRALRGPHGAPRLVCLAPGHRRGSLDQVSADGGDRGQDHARDDLWLRDQITCEPSTSVIVAPAR